MTLEPYLFFNNDCEAALNFYAATFGGEIANIKRFSEMPPEVRPPGMDDRDGVMHAQFVAPGFRFMASDGQQLAQGTSKRCVLSVNCDSHDEGERVFTALAAGGEIDEPYTAQFWGQSFGMVIDRFGILWMVSGSVE